MTLTNTGSWLLSNDPTQGIDTNSVPQSTVNQNLFDYTTQVANGSKYKEPVLAIAIVDQPISTSAPFDADGITIPLNGRVFLGFQTAPAENGIYVLTDTGLVRGDSSNTWDECVGSVFQVTGGATYAGSEVRLTINSGGTINVTPITWFDTGPSSIAVNTTNLTLTGNVINTIQDIYTGATPTFLGINVQNISVDADGDPLVPMLVNTASSPTFGGLQFDLTNVTPATLATIKVVDGESITLTPLTSQPAFQYLGYVGEDGAQNHTGVGLTYAKTTEVDFGTGGNTATVVVMDAGIPSSVLPADFQCDVLSVATADHGQEDALLEQITAKVINVDTISIPPNVTIMAYAPNGTFGKYAVMYSNTVR